jgi:subtilase family serine protease
MILSRRKVATALSVIVLLGASSIALISQNTGRRSPAVIVDPIDENKLVTIGTTRPEANADNDLGPVSDSLPMESILLQLKRTAAQDQAASAFVDDLYNPSSPNFHKWVPAAEFGKNFGVAEADIKKITSWLESYGFTVDGVHPNGMVIGFSGDAGMVRRAFRTSIHNLSVNGVNHVANFSDPQIPAALAPAVAGIVSLHNFHSDKKSRAKYTYAGGNYALVPADLATIYDFTPLFAKGTTGTGQTIAVAEDTDVYTAADWNTFRSTFGLTQYTGGTLVSKHPTGSLRCIAPGVNSDDDEATLDAQWASAAAPSATIEVAACADTNASFGELIATQNLIGSTTPPSVISISYGVCEVEFGPQGNQSMYTLFQTAAAGGISVFISAGDEGAASCDANNNVATHGIGVSGYASTPYAAAVGGTDFSDLYDGTISKYWNKTNTATYGSAVSYIPEIPWNGSCASSLLAKYYGFSVAYGSSGFCASASAASDGWVEVSGGSGGPSNCATGAALNESAGIVSGTCQGWPKPSWQTGLAGIPSDGVRDIPDVSLMASNGVWGHYYVVCFSDPNNSGTPCTGAPSNWAGFGGTSVSAPIMAGIQALVNQSLGASQGNPNPVLYSLAAGSSAAAVFHQISRGDITQNCAGLVNCYGPVGYAGNGRGGRPSETSAAGALSTSDTTFNSAYLASPASYNLATGIGSVDVANLVANWPKH